MQESLVVAAVLSEPWAILPAKMAVIAEMLALRSAGVRLSAEEVRRRIGAAAARPSPRATGMVAVIPVYGVLAHRMNLMTATSGGTSTEVLRGQLRAALADSQVKAVVLDVDSPGGSAEGIQELAADILAGREVKAIIAVANTLMASAAYWVAASASEIVMAPSGEAGSIGVFGIHEDLSRAMEMQGVRPTLISAGKYKVEGNPFEPLSEEARAAMQGRVDEVYGAFVASVARGRGVSVAEVRGGFGEGRVVGAKEAVRLGMADRVATLEQVLAKLGAAPMAAANGHRAEEARPAAGMELAAGPCPAHKSPGMADSDTPWDGPGEVAAAEADEMHWMCAWFDSGAEDADGDGFPEAKGAYKLPHHRHGDHYLVPNGLYAAAQRLDQTEMPEEDRPGVRGHLERHYGELGQESPWEALAAAATDRRRRRLRLMEHMV